MVSSTVIPVAAVRHVRWKGTMMIRNATEHHLEHHLGLLWTLPYDSSVHVSVEPPNVVCTNSTIIWCTWQADTDRQSTKRGGTQYWKLECICNCDLFIFLFMFMLTSEQPIWHVPVNIKTIVQWSVYKSYNPSLKPKPTAPTLNPPYWECPITLHHNKHWLRSPHNRTTEDGGAWFVKSVYSPRWLHLTRSFHQSCSPATSPHQHLQQEHITSKIVHTEQINVMTMTAHTGHALTLQETGRRKTHSRPNTHSETSQMV